MRCAGTSLIEILLCIVVVAVGMLGLVRIQIACLDFYQAVETQLTLQQQLRQQWLAEQGNE
jgi:Tfp pilus assembly protein PilV